MRINIITQLLLVQFCIYTGISDQNSWGSPNILTPDCNQTVSDLISDCKTESYIRWYSSKLNLDQAKRSCCHIWDVVDCFQEIVLGECDMVDYTAIRDYYRETTVKIDQDTCEDYQFYSTKCTITENDFEQELPLLEQLDLLTEIDDPPLDCLDAIHGNPMSCADKVNQDYMFTNDPLSLELELKLECCITWKVSDCFIEVAKITEECSHKDVVAYINLSKKMKQDKINKECLDYPYGNELCEIENIWNLTRTI